MCNHSHLLSLVDEDLAEEVPCDILHQATGALKGLIHRHGAHRDRAAG